VDGANNAVPISPDFINFFNLYILSLSLPCLQATSQAFWIAVDFGQTGETGLNEDEEKTITSNLQHLIGQIMPQACAVHSLLSCLMYVHKGPAFLAGANMQLESLLSRIKVEENELGAYLSVNKELRKSS